MMEKSSCHESDQIVKESFKQMKRYIRVRSQPGDRFIEFDFAIDQPELFVELIMPRSVFEIFCLEQSVIEMSEEQIAIIDAESAKWRYGEDTLMARNHSRKKNSQLG